MHAAVFIEWADKTYTVDPLRIDLRQLKHVKDIAGVGGYAALLQGLSIGDPDSLMGFYVIMLQQNGEQVPTKAAINFGAVAFSEAVNDAFGRMTERADLPLVEADQSVNPTQNQPDPTPESPPT